VKKLIILIVVLLSFSLVSCQNGAKLTMTTDSSIIQPMDISYQDLSDMIEQNDTFILYVSSETCSSCQEFEPILIEFVEIHHIMVYKIESSLEYPTNNDVLAYQFTPTIFYVLDGKVIHSADPLSDEAAFADAEGFAEFFDNWVSLIQSES